MKFAKLYTTIVFIFILFIVILLIVLVKKQNNLALDKKENSVSKSYVYLNNSSLILGDINNKNIKNIFKSEEGEAVIDFKISKNKIAVLLNSLKGDSLKVIDLDTFEEIYNLNGDFSIANIDFSVDSNFLYFLSRDKILSSNIPKTEFKEYDFKSKKLKDDYIQII